MRKTLHPRVTRRTLGHCSPFGYGSVDGCSGCPYGREVLVPDRPFVFWTQDSVPNSEVLSD